MSSLTSRVKQCGTLLLAINVALLSVDIERECSPIVAHIDGDRCAHNQRIVDVTVTAGKAAEHRNVVFLEDFAKHGLGALVCEL